MRSRQRGGANLGLLLLASQIFQMGVNNIPPVTLATLGLNVYLFLAPLAPLMQACISVQTCWGRDWRRLLLAPLHHADDWHLYYNMVSLLWKGSRLERRLGGAWFAYLLSVFSLLTGVAYLLLERGLAELTHDPSYDMQCAVGFSGVLFGLKVVNNYYYPGGATNVMGFPVANRYACWAELILIHVMSPGTSFVGHLAGILVGLLYTTGPLKSVMETCAGVLTSNGYSAGQRNYYSSSGYSGYGGTRSNYPYPQNESPRTHTSRPGFHPYATGLSEEEEYEAAIRASLRDRGGAAHESPAYGFNIPQQPDVLEEVRQRRLQRFDR
ncbi:rhomboid-related protein 4 isoform X1 [Anguilla anguilla]|uniref:rhomboid-related protein 4 isoform X1 n=1 Tax=Anguilla anguilla TaxID=7936 RepID=UPI0015AF49CF|nr:rhomboid-related protein 4 isoform X1 [Anguilla anguilla]XP_035242116.1 rhomboid-related protein 4 isoform X1 [Anguilla anguilla]